MRERERIRERWGRRFLNVMHACIKNKINGSFYYYSVPQSTFKCLTLILLDETKPVKAYSQQHIQLFQVILEIKNCS